MQSYAKVFEEEGALDKLERFAALNGPQFYGLPINETTLTLTRRTVTVPKTLPLGTDTLIPFMAGETLGWDIS